MARLPSLTPNQVRDPRHPLVPRLPSLSVLAVATHVVDAGTTDVLAVGASVTGVGIPALWVPGNCFSLVAGTEVHATIAPPTRTFVGDHSTHLFHQNMNMVPPFVP